MQRNFIIYYALQKVKHNHFGKYLGLDIGSTLSGEQIVDSILLFYIQTKCDACLNYLCQCKDSLNLNAKKPTNAKNTMNLH